MVVVMMVMMVVVVIMVMMVIVVMMMVMIILRQLDRMLIGRSVCSRALIVRVEKFNRVRNGLEELRERTCGLDSGLHSGGRGLGAAHQSERRGAAQQSDDGFIHSMSFLGP